MTSPIRRGPLWLKILTAVIVVGAGAAVVERLTRPTESAGLMDATVAALGGPREDLVLPPPVRLTNEELVIEADRLAEELAAAFPDDPRALALSGRVSFMLSTPAKALQYWEQCVKLDAKWADAWLGMAELARKQGDFENAVEYTQRLAEVAPETAREKIFIRLDCLLKAGRSREAVEALQEIGKIAPLPDWAHVMLGQGYYQLKAYEQSAEHYRQALDDPQQASVAHYGLSLALQRLGRQEEARKYREEYARLQQQSMEHFDRMQRAGTDEERNDPAPWYPVLAGFHCAAGRLYAERAQGEPARQHWLRASALAPDLPEPRQLLESLVRQ